jgi:GEVED domain
VMKTSTLNCHCIPPGSSVCTIGDLIIRVKFGTIDTSAYCSANGYGDFTNTSLTTSIQANSFAPMSVQVGCATGAPENVGVWIDFNQNGIFERSEYNLLGRGCGTTLSNNISIPTNAIAGTARMRVRVTADDRFNPSDACTHFANGETEDYKIYINAYTCPVNTWTGLGGDNNWETAGNWSCGLVPGIHSNVVINNGNVVISSNVTVYSLTVHPAATITVVPPFNLVVTH